MQFQENLFFFALLLLEILKTVVFVRYQNDASQKRLLLILSGVYF